MRNLKIWFGSAAMLGVAVVAVLTLYRSGPAPAAAAASGPPAMPVPVTSVIKRTLPVYLEYSARTESIREVSLQAKVAGYIQSQPTADGADVKEGDLLYKIDERDYRAALDQAKAQAQRNVAALDYARSNFRRGDELVKTGFLAKDNYDQRVSTLGQSEAAVAQDNAAVRTAEINLAYTDIRAPFSGRLGRNRAPVGTLVGGSGFTLNTLVQLDPIYVTFNPSERELATIEAARDAGTVSTTISLPDNPAVSYKGELTFIDNSVDRTTGTITARATVANPKFSLLPGQYVRVRVHVRDEADALLVPLTALGSSQLGKYVYVVGAGGKAEQKIVKLGPSDGESVSVTGLAEDDKVITGNLQKIGPGSPVQPLPPKQASNDSKG
ncbi:efflux RND transporter periplasmic adaptor subunit [Bradyrhizobium canariense]|uniref:Membrane fusion protein, multidrug efflux system n=1 Tax=Bradyrhizobium canariense TaxID=255045 RepID=A0A1H1XW58_9BRAD|nr:efflux RND transporter periplasmic adaptor subunit [Bradyrhizobium canariense]SDT13261.1 membrane fusion protein, multidrug efflux system [Bradyrhizobium canariense]